MWLGAAFADVRIAGKVVNENNAPVAGARVWVSDKSGLETSTDAAGAFTLRLTEPGDYRFNVERSGYFKLKDRAVTLAEGSNELQLVLNPVRDILETVDVTETPSPLDLDRHAADQRVAGNDLMNVPYPTTNNLRNALRIIPGMVQDNRGGLHLNGGSEEQILYTLDGFQLNDPLTGRFDSRVSVEAVQSIDIAGGAMAAEYGKGSAGTLSITTKSGDDRFRYSGTNFVPGLENRKGLMIGSWTPRFNLSGPMWKGRAWFSDNLTVLYNKQVVEELPKGEDRTTSWRISNHLHNQVNLTPSNILYAGFLATTWTQPRSGLSVLDPRETTVDRRSRQWFFHVKDQIYFHRGALLEFGYGGNRTFAREIPQGHGLYQFFPDGKRGNYFNDSIRSASRDQILANVVLPSFSALGAHQLKGGFDLNRVNYEQDARRTGYENYRADSTLLRRVLFLGSGAVERSNSEVATYLQDGWRPRRNLLVDVGLRADWDRLVRNWAVSPRFGFSWKPPWSEQMKISGGWALVHDATSIAVFARPSDQFPATTYFDPLGQPMRSNALSVFTIQHPSFQQPRYQNWNLGVERMLPAGLQMRANFLRRRGRRGFTYSNTLRSGQPPPEYYLEQFPDSTFDAVYDLGNHRRDMYDSFEVAMNQTLGQQYSWMVSYIRSRALSTAVVDFSADEPIIVDDNFGRMGWDSPNRLLSWGYLPTPLKNWSIAYLLETRDGFPFSIVSDDGRASEPVNSRRFPMYFDLNLHAERRFAFRKHRWALRMGFNNITGHYNPTVVNNNTSSANFLHFYGSQGRSLNFRIRWLGRL